jgi:predicted nucleic acid-binding protein
MIGNNVILDSNVIIFASKQTIDIEQVLNQYDNFYVSIITYMEVYGYDFEKPEEKELTDNLFKNLLIIDVSQEIAQYVLEYRKAALRKIKLPDAIILATARHLSATLLTDDWDDFIGIDPLVQISNIEPIRL